MAQADIFCKSDVQNLLHDKKIVFLGDSNIRALYKDIVYLYQSNSLIDEVHLKNKLEECFCGDRLLYRGQKTNGRDFCEGRMYENKKFGVAFHYLTRVLSPDVEQIVEAFRREGEPDVILINSCLWDITRWGPNGVDAYKRNLQELTKLFDKHLSKRTLIIWLTTPPISQNVRGGFLVPQLQFLQYSLRYHVGEANCYAARVFQKAGYDVLDIHYHTSKFLRWRVKDGIHWHPPVVRFMTNLVLTHISLAWGVELPNIKRKRKKTMLSMDQKYFSKEGCFSPLLEDFSDSSPERPKRKKPCLAELPNGCHLSRNQKVPSSSSVNIGDEKSQVRSQVSLVESSNPFQFHNNGQPLFTLSLETGRNDGKIVGPRKSRGKCKPKVKNANLIPLGKPNRLLEKYNSSGMLFSEQSVSLDNCNSATTTSTVQFTWSATEPARSAAAKQNNTSIVHQNVSLDNLNSATTTSTGQFTWSATEPARSAAANQNKTSLGYQHALLENSNSVTTTSSGKYSRYATESLLSAAENDSIKTPENDKTSHAHETATEAPRPEKNATSLEHQVENINTSTGHDKYSATASKPLGSADKNLGQLSTENQTVLKQGQCTKPTDKVGSVEPKRQSGFDQPAPKYSASHTDRGRPGRGYLLPQPIWNTSKPSKAGRGYLWPWPMENTSRSSINQPYGQSQNYNAFPPFEQNQENMFNPYGQSQNEYNYWYW